MGFATIGIDYGIDMNYRAVRTTSGDTWDEMQPRPRDNRCGVETDKQPDELVFPGIHYAKAFEWPKKNLANVR